MERNFYIVTTKTCALIALSDQKTKVLEQDQVIIVNKNPLKIMQESCEYYGSSLEGRLVSSKKNLGMCYKLPVIVEGSKEIIMFPTISSENDDCCWVSLKNIINYKKDDNNTIITFSGNNMHNFSMSYEMLENQMFRASKLMMIMQNHYNAQI